jgi:hypothetical protein
MKAWAEIKNKTRHHKLNRIISHLLSFNIVEKEGVEYLK